MRQNIYVRKKALNGVYFFLLAFVFSGCVDKQSQIQITGKTMGTQYHITVVMPVDTINSSLLQKKVDSLLREINRQMSTYDPQSEITQFNQYRKIDWFTVSQDFAFVVSNAQQVSKLTQGAFDVTVAPLIDLWGFGANTQYNPPTDKQITHALQSTGFELLDVRHSPPAVKKHNKNLRIDLSAIAKGFAVDKISALLKKESYTNFIVEIGGEMRLQGRNQFDKPWRVGIESPNLERNAKQLLLLSNVSLATSGDYRNYFMKDGVRYSHTINPNTGKPIAHTLASVTVLHESSMMADAYATALMVLGDKLGRVFSENSELRINMVIRNEYDYQAWENMNEIPQTNKVCVKVGGCVYAE